MERTHLAFVLAVTLAASAAAAEANLLVNTDFRSDGIGGTLNWGFGAGAQRTCTAERLPSGGPSGGAALRLGFGGEGYFSQGGMKLVEGGTYRVRVKVRTKGLGADHRIAVDLWNGEWSKRPCHVLVPADTAGAWKDVTWEGKAPPSYNGLYVLSIGGPRANAEGTVEFADPRLEPAGEAERKGSAAADPIKPFRSRIVPIDRLLSRIPQEKASVTFYYPGDLPLGTAAYELVGRLDGRDVASAAIGADRRAKLDFGTPGRGGHRIAVAVRERATGREIASDSYRARVVSAGAATGFRGRKLNNFVTEVVNAPLTNGTYSVPMPDEGWVWISLSAGDEDTEASFDLSGVPVVHFRRGEPFETMRYLGCGPHVLTVSGAPAGGRIRVHAVKRIVHCQPHGDAKPSRPDCIGFDFYRDRFARFYNTVAAYQIRARGDGRPEDYALNGWLLERGIDLQAMVCLVPDDPRRKEISTALGYLRGVDTYRDGFDLLVDETSIASPRASRYSFTEALWRMIDEGDRPAVNVFNNDAVSQVFSDPGTQASELASIMNSGNGQGMLYPEVYPAALKDPKAAFRWEDHFVDYARSIEAVAPVAADRIVWYFGTFLRLGIWTDWSCPEADIRVLYAHFIHRLATDPAYAPYIGGVSASHPGCANEDLTRFLAKLIRHYCIEGRTEYLPERYGFEYLPGYVRNADFEEGLTGWTARAAEAGGIRHEVFADFGRRCQCRKKIPKGTGDSTAVLTRSAKGPNVLEQKVTGLVPGEVYSLAFASADLEDFRQPGKVWLKTLGCRAYVAKGAKEIPELAFERLTAGHDNDRKPNARVSMRRIVFRAEAPEATIAISDWLSDDAPGAEVGRQTLVNYVRMQKYYSEGEEDLRDLIRLFGRTAGK